MVSCVSWQHHCNKANPKASESVSPLAQSAASGVGQPPAAPARSVQQFAALSLEETFQLQQSGKAVFLDARPAFFYRLGHLPGAVSVPLSGVEAFLQQHRAHLAAATRRGVQLVIYCTGVDCPDAGLLATHLANAGLSPSLFVGGWRAWRDADLPVSSDAVDVSTAVSSLPSH